MSTSNGRVTLAILSKQIADLIQLVRDHTQADREQFDEFRHLLTGKEESPGLKGRIDRLEQSESTRRWQIRSLWTAFCGGAVAVLVKWLT